MEQESRERRHRFEDQTSDIARVLQLPTEVPTLKLLLRRFLAVLSVLAERLV